MLAYRWSIRDMKERGNKGDYPPVNGLLVGNYTNDSYVWFKRFEAGRTRNYINYNYQLSG